MIHYCQTIIKTFKNGLLKISKNHEIFKSFKHEVFYYFLRLIWAITSYVPSCYDLTKTNAMWHRIYWSFKNSHCQKKTVKTNTQSVMDVSMSYQLSVKAVPKQIGL